MNAQRTTLAWILGAAVLYGTGYLIFDLLFGSFYAANAGSATGVDRGSQVLWAMVVANLAYAYLIIFAMRFRPGAGTVGGGAMTGATVGFLMWLTVDFVIFATTNISNLTRTIVDPCLEIIHGGIGGAVIGALIGSRSGSTS